VSRAASRAKILDLYSGHVPAVRYRELYGFTHPGCRSRLPRRLGPRRLTFIFSVAAGVGGLPLRAYHCGMFFKNGVPAGYVEGLSLFERMEVGFTSITHSRGRDGVAVCALAQVISRAIRCHGSIPVDPYQLGPRKRRGDRIGRVLVYRKLGFRTTVEARGNARRKGSRTRPGYRTSASTLRRLAETPLVYGDAKGEWDGFDIRQLSAVDRTGA